MYLTEWIYTDLLGIKKIVLNITGEKIIVKVCPTEEETTTLLKKVLDNNELAAKKLAQAVHQDLVLTDKNLEVINVNIPQTELAVWVDPIGKESF